MNSLNTIGYLGLAIIVFLIFREVLTWYWKTNQIVDLLKQIEKNTRASEIEIEKEMPSTDSVSKDQSSGSVWRDGKWGDK